MKFRNIAGALALLALVAGTANAQTSVTTSTGQHWAIVQLRDPVTVGRQILMGTYLIVHDDTKMANGEPCTTIYKFDPKTGPKERVVTFMCVPKKGGAPDTNILALITDPFLRIKVLRAYEFAGDPESHGVPSDLR